MSNNNDVVGSRISTLASLGDSPKEKLAWISLDDIVPDEKQDRVIDTTSESFQGLLASIKAKGGNITPVDLVSIGDGQYRLITGYTRFAACQKAGLLEIKGLIKNITDEREIQLDRLTENAVRNNLNLVEFASSVQRRLDIGISIEDIAIASGVSVKTVKTRLAINNYPDEVKQLVNDKVVNNVTRLASLKKLYTKDPEVIVRFRKAIDSGLNFDAAISKSKNPPNTDQLKETPVISDAKTKKMSITYPVLATLIERAKRLKKGSIDPNSPEFAKTAKDFISSLEKGD